MSVVSDVCRHAFWVDGRRKIELVVEFAAGGAPPWTSLVTLGRHDESPVDRLDSQLVSVELCAERHRHAEPEDTSA